MIKGNGGTMTARLLMVQGVASGVGKSTVVTALCRILRQDGYRVAPFKAQNMSLNAFVTVDGGEIGRSQATQAQAAGIEPEAAMNPVLLKPEGPRGIQTILRGRSVGYLSDLPDAGRVLWSAITGALEDLRSRFDVVIIEGAGSPVEMNLKSTDLANMRVAKTVRAPVFLVADIDRGGAFASIVGTLSLLDRAERGLVKGLVLNRFRGDPATFHDGERWLQAHTGIPVAGVIPDAGPLNLPEEDALGLERRNSQGARSGGAHALEIAVIAFPYISNFDDFQPLEHEPGVRVRYVRQPKDLGVPDLAILPGSKATVSDLLWMRETKMADAVTEFAKGGGAVFGVCGGYQMLGKQILDPHRIESNLTEIPALGLLPVSTRFSRRKTTHQSEAVVLEGRGLLEGLGGEEVSGYEIHAGETSVPPDAAAFQITRRSGERVVVSCGARDHGGRVIGCYLHGLFHNDSFRRRFVDNLRAATVNLGTLCESGPPGPDDFDRLASLVREHTNMSLIGSLLGVELHNGA